MRLTKAISIALCMVVLFAIVVPFGFYLNPMAAAVEADTVPDAKEWLAFYAVISAILGWLFAAWVQVRNSIKQHTVNTMLQSRLSSAFQEKSGKIQGSYTSLTQLVMVSDADLTDPDKQEALEAFRYMLNYYEFIAAGIRQGDFDEKLMKMSWRRILNTLVEQTAVLVAYLRAEKPDGTVGNPKVYENLLWLNARWQRISHK